MWSRAVSTKDFASVIDPDNHFVGDAKSVFEVVDPILTGLGLFGNLFILWIVSRYNIRKYPSSIFLSAIAFADSLVLILDFVATWPIVTFDDVNLLNENERYCVFHQYFFRACVAYAIWCNAAFILERCLIIWGGQPERSRIGRSAAIIIVCILTLPVFAVFLRDIWSWGFNNQEECAVLPDSLWFMTWVHPWIFASVVYYVPMFVVFCCTVLTISAVCSCDVRIQERKDVQQFSAVGIAFAIYFIVLVLPAAVWDTYHIVVKDATIDGNDFLAAILIHLLFLLYFAIKFFLCILVWPLFRQELAGCCCCRGSTDDYDDYNDYEGEREVEEIELDDKPE